MRPETKSQTLAAIDDEPENGAEGAGAWTASPCNPDLIGRILKSDYSGRSSRLLGVYRVSLLSELNVGQRGVVVELDLPDSVQNHLMHMGFVPNALVTTVRRAPAGDPTVYLVDGLEIALRRETARAIRVKVPRTLTRQQEQELLESARNAAQPESTQSEPLQFESVR
jgi:ferrous iron transport protein A